MAAQARASELHTQKETLLTEYKSTTRPSHTSVAALTSVPAM